MPTLTVALKALGFGQVTPVPALAPFAFQIAQRVAPEPEPYERYETELPAPHTPDLEYQVGQMKLAELEIVVRWAENHLTTSGHSAVVARMQPSSERARLLEPRARPAARRAALHALLERARTVLPDRDYEEYLASLQLGVADVLMTSTSHPRLALGF
jgi:hypothetical protein